MGNNELTTKQTDVLVEESRMIVYGQNGEEIESPFQRINFERPRSILTYGSEIEKKLFEIIVQQGAIVVLDENHTVRERANEEEAISLDYANELQPYIDMLEETIKIGRKDKDAYDEETERLKTQEQDSETLYQIMYQTQISEVFGNRLCILEKGLAASKEIVKRHKEDAFSQHSIQKCLDFYPEIANMSVTEYDQTKDKPKEESKGKTLLKSIFRKRTNNKQKED